MRILTANWNGDVKRCLARIEIVDGRATSQRLAFLSRDEIRSYGIYGCTVL
jgi:hypothetical protein